MIPDLSRACSGAGQTRDLRVRSWGLARSRGFSCGVWQHTKLLVFTGRNWKFEKIVPNLRFETLLLEVS